MRICFDPSTDELTSRSDKGRTPNMGQQSAAIV